MFLKLFMQIAAKTTQISGNNDMLSPLANFWGYQDAKCDVWWLFFNLHYANTKCGEIQLHFMYQNSQTWFVCWTATLFFSSGYISLCSKNDYIFPQFFFQI